MVRLDPARSRPVYGATKPTPKPPERAPESGGFFGFFKSLFSFLDTPPPTPPLVRAYQGTDAPLLVARGEERTFVGAGASLDTKDIGGPPVAETYAELAKLEQPVVAFAKSAAGAPFGLVTPAGFDPATSGSMRVRTVIPPKGSSVQAVVQALAKNPPNVPGTVFVVSDRKQPAYEAKSQVLEHLLHLSADFGTHHTLLLDGSATAWRGALEQDHGAKPARLDAPILGHTDGSWSQFPPTTNYKIRLPSPGQASGAPTIPKELQKQSADRGTFLAPVMKSEALRSTVRFGVYLPPGYDPDAKEKYPVLVLLPGKGDLLSHWSSVGQLGPKLDHMMQGDAQKMIVVVADGNESFFVNDEPDAKDPRNYQDFFTKELVGYATEQLAGDPEKLSLAGISRGGYGAVVAAAQHPGMFRSVSSHSGSLGPQRNTKSTQNPTRIAREGAFDEGAPRLRFDIGANDPYFVSETIDLAALLTARGTNVDTHILESAAPGGDKHNWDLWSPSLESWIAYHQETYGEAGRPRSAPDAKDVGQQKVTARVSVSDRAWSDLANIAFQMSSTIRDIRAQVDTIHDDCSPDLRDAFGISGLKSKVAGIAASADELEAIAKAKDGLFDQPVSQRRATLQRAVDDAIGSVDRLVEGLDIIAAMPKAAQADIAKTLAEAPSLREPLLGLAAKRPALFAGDDPVTKKNFAAQVRHHVEHFLDEAERPGFGEFLRRMTTGTYKWKVGGFSHSFGPGLATWIAHPGLVLSLVEASKQDKPFGLHEVYDGDGPSALPPSRDLANAWRPIMKTKGDGASTSNPAILAGSEFRYERGLCHTIVDELAPKFLPSDRKGGKCAPVALALQKLTGVETHYYYAFNIKNGADLAKALESQAPYGIAMADVHVGHDPEKLSFSHFPVFYDYDPESNSCMWQDFSSRPPQRIPLDTLEFAKEGRTRCAIYCRPNEGLAPLLTLEEQTGSQGMFGGGDLRWGERAMLEDE